jgi:hypothetical protein
MAFAFARLSAAGTDEAESFFTLDEAHHEQSALTRITDDHFAVFTDRVIRILFDPSNIIVEHGLRLGEGDFVLAEIAAFLFRVPFECPHSDESFRC